MRGLAPHLSPSMGNSWQRVCHRWPVLENFLSWIHWGAMGVCYDLHKCGIWWGMVRPLWGWPGQLHKWVLGQSEGSELNDCIGSLVSTSFIKWVPMFWLNGQDVLAHDVLESKFISRLGDCSSGPQQLIYVCTWNWLNESRYSGPINCCNVCLFSIP